MHFRNTTKIAVPVLALNHALVALLLSFSLNCELIIQFGFAPSFNHDNSTSLIFSEFSELFTSILLLAKHIESLLHFHLPGGTSDIIMSVLHKSLMFLASLMFFMVSFLRHSHGSLGFLSVPHLDFF